MGSKWVKYPKEEQPTMDLLRAVWKNDLAGIELAISNGGNANGFSVKGQALPIQGATSAEVAELLLQHGASAKTRNPLFYANAEVSEVLLRHGASPDAKGLRGMTPLHQACAGGNEDKVKHLIEAGASLSATSEGDCSALHFAANDKIVQRLVAAGADLEARDQRDRTPLHVAIEANQPMSKVKALIEAGADVNAVAAKRSDMTPLHMAAEKWHTEKGLALLNAGADPLALDQTGASCIDYAEKARDGKLIHAMNEVVAKRQAQQLDALTSCAAGAWSPSDLSGDHLIPKTHGECQAPVQRHSRRL